MKMKSSVLSALFFLFLLVGCSMKGKEAFPYESVNTLDGIWMEIKEDSISPTELTVVLFNETGMNEFLYGAWFRLEEYIDGQWFSVSALPDVEWAQEDWGRRVYAGEQGEVTYSWEWYYGSLKQGRYRIMTEIMLDSDLPTKDGSIRRYLAEEFSVGLCQYLEHKK